MYIISCKSNEESDMIIKKKSVLTGVVHSKEIPIKMNDYNDYKAGFGALYDIAPYLSSEDREFIISGITGDEWRSAFSDEIAKIVSDKFA